MNPLESVFYSLKFDVLYCQKLPYLNKYTANEFLINHNYESRLSCSFDHLWSSCHFIDAFSSFYDHYILESNQIICAARSNFP